MWRLKIKGDSFQRFGGTEYKVLQATITLKDVVIEPCK